MYSKENVIGQVMDGKLVIVVTSDALFRLPASACGAGGSSDGARDIAPVDATREPLPPGPAFGLVKKLLRLNSAERQPIEVVVVCRHSADMGLQVFDSFAHHELAISRAAFTNGAARHRYAAAFGAHLFLSTDPDEVRCALRHGIAAATVMGTHANAADDIVRLAFDGDAVLFSDEAERVFVTGGLDAFAGQEVALRHKPLDAGPLRDLLVRIQYIQAGYLGQTCPLRTALVTARAAPAHERALRTLGSWGLRVDEVMFLGGMSKGGFLAGFGADIFFDDHPGNCDNAGQHVLVGHVPYGINNEHLSRPPLRLVALPRSA